MPDVCDPCLAPSHPSVVIVYRRRSGTFDVKYDDDEIEEKLPTTRLRPRAPDCGKSIAELDSHATADFGGTLSPPPQMASLPP